MTQPPTSLSEFLGASSAAAGSLPLDGQRISAKVVSIRSLDQHR
jgi:hypothetical protein